MIKHKDQRVAVLIDVQNMYHCAKNLYNARVNFKEILKEAVSERQFIRASAYVVQSNSEEEENFFEALSNLGFEVRMKELQIFSTGAKKGDWDVGIAIDAVKLSEKVDAIVLVTGDGDFIPLVRYLQENKGCQVEVISFQETTSNALIEVADDFFNLSAEKKRFLIRSRKSN